MKKLLLLFFILLSVNVFGEVLSFDQYKVFFPSTNEIFLCQEEIFKCDNCETKVIMKKFLDNNARWFFIDCEIDNPAHPIHKISIKQFEQKYDLCNICFKKYRKNILKRYLGDDFIIKNNESMELIIDGAIDEAFKKTKKNIGGFYYENNKIIF